MTLKSYYSDREVVRRITEYLGGRYLEEATAVFVVRCDGFNHPPTESIELGFYLARKLDIARSLWDRQSLLEHYAQGFAPRGEPISSALARAFAGLGMIVEFLAQRLITASYPSAEIPVEITNVVPGPQKRGREVVSIDLSEYGDPLNTRIIRVPFSLYSKHRPTGGLSMIVPIPFPETSLEQAIRRMRDPAQAAELATHTSIRIPDFSKQTEGLLEEYLRSSLAAFHRSFYELDQEPPEHWPESYDRASFRNIPYCIRYILDHPNDLLLKPAAIRQAVRTLLAVGWHPRHIAGLIRSKYERDHGWGEQWLVSDAATRADFYVRIFAGLIATGIDRLSDFNCLYSKEKGLCFVRNGQCNLADFSKILLERNRP